MANHSYWRIYNRPLNNNSQTVQISEIEMYATANSSTNLCTGGSAFAGSQYSSSYPPSNAFDGNTATAWWSSTAASVSTTIQWVAYQFASPVSIEKIKITPAVSNVIPLGNFDLMWSDNGTTWTTYASFSWPIPANARPLPYTTPQTFSTTNTTITWNSPSAGVQPNLVGLNTYAFVPSVSVSNAVGSTTFLYYNGSPPRGDINPETGIIDDFSATSTLNNANSAYAFTVRAINNGRYLDRTFSGNVIVRSNASNITSVTWNGPQTGNELDPTQPPWYPVPFGRSTVGTFYNLVSNVAVSNAIGQTTYYISRYSEPLPPGTTLNAATGVLSGTLSSTDSASNFNIRSVNNFVISEKPFSSVVVNTSIAWNNPSALGNTTGGSNYTFTANTTVTSSFGDTVYKIVGGALPEGTSLQNIIPPGTVTSGYSTTGIVSGILTNVTAPYSFTMRAMNNFLVSDRTFTGNIIANPTNVTWISPAAGAQPNYYSGTAYNFISNVSVSNAIGLTTFSLISGTVPYGTSLNTSNGAVLGTLASNAFTYAFTLSATNNNSSSVRTFTGNVVTNPTATTITWNNPAGVQANVTGGTVYDFTANTTVTYPVGPTVYSILSGSIPYGTVFDSSSGTIFGVLPTSPSSYSFTIRASNNGALVDISLSGNILTPTSVSWYDTNTITRSAYANNDYYASNAAVTITNPVGSTTFSLVSGSLMSGTSLDTTTGLVSGTVSVGVGTYSYTLRATNNGSTVDRLFSGNTVDLGTTVITWITPAAGALPVYGTNQSQYYFLPNITVSNPSGLTTASIVSGSIPIGTTFNASTGEISGKNPVAGNYSFTMRATNNGKTLDRSFTSLVVSVAVTSVTWVSPSDQGTFNGNSNYNFVPSITLTSAAGPTVYSIVAGAIPSGTTFDPKTGIISGTLPNITTSYSYTMRATVYTTYSNRTFSGNVIAV